MQKWSRKSALLALVGACAVLAQPTPSLAYSLSNDPSGVVTPDPDLTPFAGVTLGADRLIAAQTWPQLTGRRLGLITNQTGVLRSGETLLAALAKRPDLDLQAIFSPEHGLHGNHAAGGTVTSSVDAQTGKPVYSLYGDTKRPTPEMLDDVDILLFDIQDVGARTYTYISTLALAMQAAGELGKTVWVLDRPNPIGGTIVEGPVLEPALSSFIGLYPLPMRHGLTVGEIATMYRQSFGIHCDLYVLQMTGYSRDMLWPQTKLKWIPTSPNIPHFRTALVYLTTGPLGAAGIINGVGSGLPFEVALAPKLDGVALAEVLNRRGLPGVHFSPAFWTPQEGYWSGTRLDGIQIHVAHPAQYLAVRTGIEILAAIRQLSPQTLRFSDGFDRDWGTATLRHALQTGASTHKLEQQWAPRLAAFKNHRRRALLYTD